MNTERSEQFVKAWMRNANPLERASFVAERRFNAVPEAVFGLLCPTTELDWLPGWQCELLHSDSGYAELNAVFRTQFFGREEIWVCTRYEPNRMIVYTRVSEEVSSTMTITLTDHRDGSVTGTWDITASALNERGNAAVAELAHAEAEFEAVLDGLEHYVNTGKMIALAR
jgi:uncharacterized protein YndB with AHSA1/START domain